MTGGMFVFVAASGLLAPPAPTSCPSPAQETTWKQVVEPYLASPLWEPKTAYNAGHILLIPLHGAFATGDTTWQRDFAEQFAAFVKQGTTPPSRVEDRLGRDQYLYLASTFLVLAARSGHPELIPRGLPEALSSALDQIWNRDAVAASGHSMQGGLHARLSWKMTGHGSGPQYQRVVDDRDRFSFATAANLLVYYRVSGKPTAAPGWLKGVIDDAWDVFQKRVEWQADGGWLFQPGYWNGYKDFAYSGDTSVAAPMAREHPHQTEDVSHAFRWPAWVSSLDAEAEGNAQRKAYYDRLLKGLEIQFLDHVVVPPDSLFAGYRLRNFMDGWNGLYRWTAEGAGGHGVGPYGLSGSATMGWWSLLGTKRSRDFYASLLKQFPLSPEVEGLYARGGSDDSGAGGAVNSSYRNGLRELIVGLGACLPLRAGYQ